MTPTNVTFSTVYKEKKALFWCIGFKPDVDIQKRHTLLYDICISLMSEWQAQQNDTHERDLFDPAIWYLYIVNVGATGSVTICYMVFVYR